MPGSATLYLEQAVLGHTLAFAPMPETAAVYIGLTAPVPVPTSTAGGAEVTGTGYARQAATFALIASPPNVAANSATIAFPAAGDDTWGAVGFFEIWDAATGGHRLYQGPLVNPADGITPITRTILTGDIVRFTAGVIQVTAT